MRQTYPRTAAFASRRSELPYLLNARGLFGEGVEVGVQQGMFASEILSVWRGTRLHLVDPWRSFDPDDYVDIANHPQEIQDQFHSETLNRMRRFGDRSTVHRLESPRAADVFPDGSLDFVYLDARHDYPSVMEDLRAWYPKIHDGGILAGHDYIDGLYNSTEFGVRRAVKEFGRAHHFLPWSTLDDGPWVSFFAVVGLPGQGAAQQRLIEAARYVARLARLERSAQLPEAVADRPAGP